MAAFDDTITMTLGDYLDNLDIGLTLEELTMARQRLEAQGQTVKIVDLREALPPEMRDEAEPAYLMLVRQGNFLNSGDVDALYQELKGQPFDTKYYDTQRFKILNKRARYNLCIADYTQEPDHDKGLCTIVNFKDLPVAAEIRTRVEQILGPKAHGLIAETNFYYDPKKCGIGFHGDSERRVAASVRLGASLPLHFHWYYRGSRVGRRIKMMLHHGDFYVMADKTVGHDYRRSDILTLRHAAGAEKYLK